MKSIPKWLALSLASAVETVWRLLNIESIPKITKFDIAFVAMARKYNISKIKNELGYKPVISEEEGLREMEK